MTELTDKRLGADLRTRFEDVEKLELKDIFPADMRLEFEIGCGKGKFIVDRALENSDINFIAVDKFWKYMKVGEQRAERNRLENVRFFKSDAPAFIQHVLPDESVDMFHMYFPDPWPKRRHQRRRLFNPDFLKLIHRKTKEKGIFEIATDHEHYYECMMEDIRASKDIWSLEKETVDDRIIKGNVITNYEAKWEREGRTLHYMELKKL